MRQFRSEHRQCRDSAAMGHHTIKLWLALPKSCFLRNVIDASAHAAKKAIGLLRKAAQSRSDSQRRKPVEVRIAPEPVFPPSSIRLRTFVAIEFLLGFPTA